VVEVRPGDGAADVPITSQITVTFSRPPEEASARAGIAVAPGTEGYGRRSRVSPVCRPFPGGGPGFPGVAGLGDGASALGLPRAELAGHEPEVGLDLMGAAEASDVIDGGNEGGGGDRADARDGAQALDARIVGREPLDGLVGVRDLGVEVAHDREQGAIRESNCPGRAMAWTRCRNPSALPNASTTATSRSATATAARAPPSGAPSTLCPSSAAFCSTSYLSGSLRSAHRG
jgi:hypothetical protein